MKITISKTQWEFIGKQAGWTKKAQADEKWFIETYIDGQQMLGSDGTSILKSINNLGDAINDQIQRIQDLIPNVKPYIADAKKIIFKVVSQNGEVVKTFDVTKYVLDDISKKASNTKFLVVDNDFNQAHYPELIGKTFDEPPSYAVVKKIKASAKSGKSMLKTAAAKSRAWYIFFPHHIYALGPIRFDQEVGEQEARLWAKKWAGLNRLPAGFKCWPTND